MNTVPLIIGEDHYNTLGLVRSLGESGLPVYVVLKSVNRKTFVARSRYVKKIWIVENIDSIIKLLNSQSFFEKRVIVYCSSDELVNELDFYKNSLGNNIILPICSNSLGGFSELTNKNHVSNLAKDFGILIPKSWKVTNELIDVFLNSEIKEIDFKCILKPAKSEYGVKDDIKICNNRDDIEKELRLLLLKMEAVQIQEFIEKDIEINLLGASLVDGSVIIPGIMYKLKHNKNHYEFYSEIRPIENNMRPLVKQICDFVKYIGYKGLFGVELMLAKDKVYFLEINLRNDANSYSITKGGVNLPYIYFLSCSQVDYTKEEVELKYKCNYVNEIAYFKYLFQSKFEIWEFIKIMFKADCFMYYNKRDKKPFYYKYLKNIF